MIFYRDKAFLFEDDNTSSTGDGNIEYTSTSTSEVKDSDVEDAKSKINVARGYIDSSMGSSKTFADLGFAIYTQNNTNSDNTDNDNTSSTGDGNIEWTTTITSVHTAVDNADKVAEENKELPNISNSHGKK